MIMLTEGYMQAISELHSLGFRVDVDSRYDDHHMAAGDEAYIHATNGKISLDFGYETKVFLCGWNRNFSSPVHAVNFVSKNIETLSKISDLIYDVEEK